ncbi:hypothetical protein ACHAXT_011086 [Thalassiosira profunda]
MGKAARQRKAPKGSGGGANRSAVPRRPTSAPSSSAAVASSGPGPLSLLLYAAKALVLAALSLPFWILTALLSIIYGRPPKMVYLSQTARYLRYAYKCTEISLSSKMDLALTIVLHTATSPVAGFCWLLDEILYRKQLNSISVEEPLFVLSAYRSASTDMARQLAKDTDRFVAPNALMCAFPYLWLWRLVMRIVGDDSGISTEEANGYLNKKFTKESLERHDNDHFGVDTYDGYFLSSHLNGLAFQLGPDVIAREFNCAKFEEHNRHLFEECFVAQVDRLARKTLLFNDAAAADPKTFLLKGHFLQSAPALRRKYPDARFLAVLRDPLDRLRSGINHTACNPTLWQGRPPRWEWLATAFPQIEAEYCAREMEWYGDGADERRLAVKFDAFVKDRERTMRRVYGDLLKEDDPPDFAHPKKGTPKRYTVDRTLVELGVDEKDLKRFAGYQKWMKEQ